MEYYSAQEPKGGSQREQWQIIEPVAERGEHGEAVRSMRRGRRSAGDYPPDRPLRSPAHHTEGGNHRVRLVGRSVGHVHSSAFRSLALTALRFASHHLPCFPECPVDRMTPMACRVAPAPAAAPARSSHHAPHRVRRCRSGTLILFPLSQPSIIIAHHTIVPAMKSARNAPVG